MAKSVANKTGGTVTGRVSGRGPHPNVGEMPKAEPPAGDFSAVRPALVEVFKAHRAASIAMRDLETKIFQALTTVQEQGNRGSHLVAAYRRIRDAVEGAPGDARVPTGVETILKDIKAKIEMLAKNLIPEAFEREGVTTLTIIGGDRATITQRVFASIPAAVRTEAYAWLRKNKGGDLIQQTVNAASLSAWVKAELEQGRAPPEKLITTHIDNNTSLTRGSGQV